MRYFYLLFYTTDDYITVNSELGPVLVRIVPFYDLNKLNLLFIFSALV